MFQIRKKFKFEAAHILDSSFSKCCQKFHGHSYIVEVFFQSEELNEDGMVIDFGELKGYVQPLIDNWDHVLILSGNADARIFAGMDFWTDAVKTMNCNPTAENMAKYLFDKIKNGFEQKLTKIRVQETDTGYAEYWEE